MSYLLRRTRKSVWGGETRSREQAIQEFARSEQDTDGLSLFEVENDEERRLVVAAIACEREKVDRVDLIEMERAELEVFGSITRTPDHGTTPVVGANALHCSLAWDSAQLRRLAEKLFDEERLPKETARPDVRAAVCSLQESDVIGASAKNFVREEKAKPPSKQKPQ